MPLLSLLARTHAARAAGATIAALAMAMPSQAQTRRPSTPPIGHVFIIVLENTGFDTTFGPHSRAPYLADTLTKRGALLTRYYGTGHYSLDNYVTMVSGIAPTRDTQFDCGHYLDFVDSGAAGRRVSFGQPVGRGCVYPARVQTIANQLEATGRTWKGFMEDMGNIPTREPRTCGHPALGTLDSTERAAIGDQYAAKHDPFVYFHAIIDSPTCERNVVPLTELPDALRSVASTPSYSFISPSLCHDGHDRPCVDGQPGGLVSADAFLREWVPRITSSPAFRKDGLLIITFDEALSIDARGCCHEPSGPNVDSAGVNGPGGGRIGAVLLSPFIRPATRSAVPYNHYSMLRSVEDIFRLPHLGYAAMAGLRPFGSDVYTAPTRKGARGATRPARRAAPRAAKAPAARSPRG